MDIKELKRLVEKGVKGSGEKQVKLFMTTRKSEKFFKEAIIKNNK